MLEVKVDPKKSLAINDFITTAEKQYGIKVILAVESGSRAWGFPSQDSDYDIRLIYRHPMQWYISPFTKKDVIENIFLGDLDLTGWDVAKALALMHKSNASLCEWLHSPVVYRDDTAKSSLLRQLSIDSFNSKPIFYHYLSLSKKKLLSGGAQKNAKSFLYALRALLCARWVAEQRTIPPVNFFELTQCYLGDVKYSEQLGILLEDKAQQSEQDNYTVPKQLYDYALTELARLQDVEVNVPLALQSDKAFDDVLYEIVQ